MEHVGEVVGESVGVVVLIGHHFVVIRLLLVLLLARQKPRPDLLEHFHAVHHLLLLEHEGMLDVALLYVLGHQAKLLGLVKRPFLLVAAPKSMRLRSHCWNAHRSQEPWQEVSPRFLYLPDFCLNEVNQFRGRLANSAL